MQILQKRPMIPHYTTYGLYTFKYIKNKRFKSISIAHFICTDNIIIIIIAKRHSPLNNISYYKYNLHSFVKSCKYE